MHKRKAKMDIVPLDKSIFGKRCETFSQALSDRINRLGKDQMLRVDVSRYGRPNHVTALISLKYKKGEIPRVATHIDKQEKVAYIRRA